MPTVLPNSFLLCIGQFSVLPDGSVTLQFELDYENIRSYNLTISAMDSGFPSLSGTANLVINILDVNDNLPLINVTQTQYDASEVWI